MQSSEKRLAIMSAAKNNILPITSVCNLDCIFCSHQGNPSGIESYYPGNIDFAIIKEIASYLDSEKKIIIGESMTKICEGEPLLHPEFKQIIKFLRVKFPQSKLKITTNGSLLNAGIIKFLANNKPLELNLSLNSSSVKGRKKLMGDKKFKQEMIDLLVDYNLAYHGSVVAMPWVVGEQDLVNTILFLADNNALSIRVFIPGYTRSSPAEVKYEAGQSEKIRTIIKQLKKDYQLAITLEPIQVNDLRAKIAGVMSKSPVDEAGVKVGDEILKINQQKVFSRTSAFDIIYQSKNPTLKIKRGNDNLTVKLKKGRRSFSGLVMNYDFSVTKYNLLLRELKNLTSKKVLFLTSELAAAVMAEVISLLSQNLSDCYLEQQVVENRFFGGSIACAGLLLVSDFAKALSVREDLKSFDLILLPSAPFDFQARDLCGISWHNLEEDFKVRCAVID